MFFALQTAAYILGTVLSEKLIAVLGKKKMTLGVLLLGIGGLLFLRARQAAPADEAQRIQRRYGALLVAIRGSDAELHGPLVEVATIDDLAKLAERGGYMILHQDGQRAPRYLVQAGDVTYRYMPDMPAPAGRLVGPAL